MSSSKKQHPDQTEHASNAVQGPEHNEMRRRFLKATGLGVGGALLGIGGLAGCDTVGRGDIRDNVGFSSTNPVEKPEFSFANTVTLDVTSGDNIDAALQDAVADDTLVRIPAGTYQISSDVDMPDKAGIEGIGKVRLELAAGNDFYHINADSEILYIDNLHYDLSEANNGTGVKAYVSEKGYVGHVCITGRADANPVVNGLALAAREPDSVLMIEEFVDIGRGTGSHTGNKECGGNGRIGFWSGNGYHEGLAYLKNCTVIDAANNALYASNLGEGGRFHVNGGFYLHSYGAGLRTGGHGTILENAYIEVDMRESKRNWCGAQPAIRWEVKGDSTTSEGLIRNCDIRMINGKFGQAIRLQRSAAKVTVRDCRVQMETADPALDIYGTGPDEYKFPAPDEDRRVYVDGLEVTGSAATQVPSIDIGEGRDESVVKNCHVPGGIRSESELITENNVEEMGTPPEAQEPPNCGVEDA